ncbi:MAG: saccharopine dehydrogenase NADP-binding domain-containing protein [Xanthomonadales bacterium]|nr:saccharopine dehydrogenase NADP-binding domain-containing protein [Xanthomonadales bacterium]
MSKPPFDVVVFGASSFVGAILSRYLWGRHGASGELRWAMAGRSKAKLEAVRAGFDAGGEAIPLIEADAADEAALRAMCAQTRVIVSTVGPYALYGEPLVKVCADTGTDYCDLTGEPQWIARMLERYEDKAKQSGARIVHCCGFDSIPSDLGVWFLQREAKQRYGHPLPRVRMRVRTLRGGFSGGTVASLLNAVDEAKRDPAMRKALANPYSLCPPGTRNSTRQPKPRSGEFDPEFKVFTAPFVMAAINTRIVQRSNALLGRAYGEDFRYDEAMMTGRGFKGRFSGITAGAGLGGFMVAAAIPPTRWALEKFVLPAPGEGPTPEQQEKGRFDMRFHGRDAHDHTLVCKVTGDRDPGYGSTGKMLGEAAACLALETPKEQVAGGFLTPATAMGDRLIERLVKHAGLEFEVLGETA